MDRRGFIEGQPISWWIDEYPTFVCVTAAVEHKGQVLTTKLGVTNEAMTLSAVPERLFQHTLMALERGLREQVSA